MSGFGGFAAVEARDRTRIALKLLRAFLSFALTAALVIAPAHAAPPPKPAPAAVKKDAPKKDEAPITASPGDNQLDPSDGLIV